MIDEVSVGEDGLVREVVIRYRNSSEGFDRFSNRAARSCVRLHNMDDNNLADDLHELTERLNRVDGGAQLVAHLGHVGQVEYNSPLNVIPEPERNEPSQPSPAGNVINNSSITCLKEAAGKEDTQSDVETQAVPRSSYSLGLSTKGEHSLY